MTKRAALYARTSTDKNQTVENQLRQLNEVAVRLGWVVVGVFTDEGISGVTGRDRRPGYDAMLKGIARREFDLVATWSVCRLGAPSRILSLSSATFRRRALISTCTSKDSTRARHPGACSSRCCPSSPSSNAP